MQIALKFQIMIDIAVSLNYDSTSCKNMLALLKS